MKKKENEIITLFFFFMIVSTETIKWRTEQGRDVMWESCVEDGFSW